MANPQFIITTAMRTELATPVQTALSEGKLRLYSGAGVDPQTGPTGDLLVEFSLHATNGESNGVITLGTIAPADGLAAAGAGTDALTGWFYKSNGTTIIGVGDVGKEDYPAPGDRYSIELDNVNIAENQTVTVTSGTVTVPSGA